ncbi:MAG: UbiD family decarboxylase [Candidatus Rokubacteria bacterium]|nr:UbiD family decarboxylase [Candidatus Rokubacteria bacterium]
MRAEFDLQAIALELERRRRFPILLFEKVVGHDIPVIANVMASRRVYAFALGTGQGEMPAEYARRLKQYVKPVVVDDPPFRRTLITGDRVDIRQLLPLPTYFPGDGGPYLTAGLACARDPDTGVETAGYHRFQAKAANRMGVSLHSRRRMFEYQRRAEAQGRNLECAIVLGLHPLVGLAALSYPPPETSKFEAAGGLFQEPMQLARCETVDLLVPAWAEIVIEGEILAGVREPEGPFGEFTGYFSSRSTEHVFLARAVAMRERPWFQSVASGRAPDHILPLGVLREVEIRNALARAIPNVTAVHVPTSGCASFIAFVSIKQTRPGEARHAIPIVLGVDHYLKLVVIVDDDIDVFDESDVLWAMATRMQADRDLVLIERSLGAILDPSATERGLTAKLGIDATRPFGESFAQKLVMAPERETWARELVSRLLA